MTQATFVCLANSRKLSGRCMAGKRVDEFGNSSWIRPISNRPDEELSEMERRYANQIEPKLLDVIQAEFTLHKPTFHQQENWVIDPSVPFVKTSQLLAREVVPLVDSVSELWENGSNSYAGINDRFSESLSEKFSHSLVLLLIDELKILVQMDYTSSKKEVRGKFHYLDHDYLLKITDPIVENVYRQKVIGAYDFGKCLVTISLGEKSFYGYFYKFIAGVIPIEESR